MNALSLFSGIGGIDLACDWAGIKTVAFCEREPFCQAIIRKHWPGVPIYEDVRTLTKARLEEDGIDTRTIRLISAGYPCQPFSLAGNREGEEDDRHLWPEVFRLNQEIRPDWFLGENVAGHVTLGLDNVLSDLGNIGYTFQPFVIPACAVNAPHRRDRVFIVAHANGIRNDSKGEYRINRNRQEKMQQRFESFLGLGNQSETIPDTTGTGLPERRQPGFTESDKETGAGMVTKFERCGENVADPSSIGQQGQREFIESLHTTENRERKTSESLDVRIRNQWAVEPDVGRVANGVPNRVDRLKSLGNAVVPQQIYPILAAIKQIDDMMRG